MNFRPAQTLFVALGLIGLGAISTLGVANAQQGGGGAAIGGGGFQPGQQPPGGGGFGGGGFGGGGGGAITSDNNNIYVLRGNQVIKISKDMQVVGTMNLPAMQGGGQRPGGGAPPGAGGNPPAESK